MNQEKKVGTQFFTNNKDKAVMAVLILLMIIIIGQLWYIGGLKKESLAASVQAEVTQEKQESQDRQGSAVDRYYQTRAWEPFQEMNRMQQTINRLFNDSFFRGGYGLTAVPQNSLFYEPDIDIQETGDNYIIKVDMPGMKKENISVTVKNNYLTIEGERSTETEEQSENERFFRVERSFGTFQRTIPLPGEVDDTALMADYKKGVLTIILPKIVPDGEGVGGTKVPVN